MDVRSRTPDTAHVFHINKTLYADKYLDERLKSGRITADDASLLQSYIAERKATRHLSVGRVNKIYFTLLRWRDFVPPFRENTIHDVYKGIGALGNARKENGSPRFARNTISDTVATVKTFYLWMIEEGYSAIPEKKLQQIKRPPQDAVTKTAEDLITADEIERMVSACTWTRDRALLLTLYEGGMRIGEIGTLTWGDVKFDEKGVVITVKSQKTEKARYLRLVMAREHLARWKADYPGEARADAPVFISTRREPLAYSTLTKQIQRIAKRAGMEKRITPHLFRHSRITDLVREGLPESTIKMMMWNNQGTDMLNRYTHLTGGDIDTQILEASGIRIRPEDARPVLKPLQCSRCYAICAPTSRFCCECGNPLTEEAAKDLGETVHRLDEIIPALSTGQLDEIADRVAEKLSRLERRNPRPSSTMGDQK